MTPCFRGGPVVWLALVVLVVSGPVVGQDEDGVDLDELVREAVAFLVERQEGEGRREWPYEGVYREGGAIPWGYRVGGTALVCRALLAAPGWDEDVERRAAVERGVDFVLESVASPSMGHAIEAGYDVRAWGWGCALHLLAELVLDERVPAGRRDEVEAAALFFLDGLSRDELVEAGGWNYARRRGRTSPFMTATVCQALFSAQAAGWPVDGELVVRSLEALERGRAGDGGIVYSGKAGSGGYEGLPGSVGRMLAVESTLHLAGRADVGRVRGAVDAFFVHWQRLEERRARTGTHKPPYGVAPYYFYYAHDHAARSIELLPEGVRDEYRRHLLARVMRTRDADGTWNDRVFERSVSYGTAMVLLSLTAPERGRPTGWGQPVAGAMTEPDAAAEQR